MFLVVAAVAYLTYTLLTYSRPAINVGIPAPEWEPIPDEAFIVPPVNIAVVEEKKEIVKEKSREKE